MEHETSFWKICDNRYKIFFVHRRTGHESLEEEQRYSSTLSLTSALDGVGGQRHAPAALPRKRHPIPIAYNTT
jgi:hypothetical protein